MIYKICRQIKGHTYYVRFNPDGFPMYLYNPELAARYPSKQSANYLVSRWSSHNLYITGCDGEIKDREFLALYEDEVLTSANTINELKDKIFELGFGLNEIKIVMEV